MEKTPICRKCNVALSFDGFASMGSSHSNWYRCKKCGNTYLIRDEDLVIKTDYYVG